jgi:hypothetical protein
MSQNRPDWIKCILQPFKEKIATSLCGHTISGEFHFQGIDHAYAMVITQGRLIPCPECTLQALKILNSALKIANESIENYKPEEDESTL